MKRYEYEKAVYESAADSVAKGILLYYGHRKNWAADGKVWVSAATVAGDLGLSISSVNRRVPKLRESGWLNPTGRVVGNGAVEYDLAIGQSLATEKAAPTPIPERDTTSTQTSTPVTERTTTRTETDKEVINKENNKMKEEVKADATASVTGHSLVRGSSSPSSTSSNSKNWAGLSQREIRERLYAEMNVEKQIGRDIVEEEIASAGLTADEANAARKRYESSTFMARKGPAQRAINAVYWRPEVDTSVVSPGTWGETW